MTNRKQEIPNDSTHFAKKMSALAIPILALVFGMLGFVLLVAGKTIAGSAFVCSALILFLPLNRITARSRLAIWLRAAVIAVLCIIAIRSIANTDIEPGRGTTGYVFVDQVLAIFRRFQDIAFGKTKAMWSGEEKGTS